MSVKFIVGKPGGGKTLRGVTLIVDDLVKTDAVIVTNIPVKFDALNEYIQRKYPTHSVDLHERLVMLEDEDVFEFYRYRSGGLVLGESPDKRQGIRDRGSDRKLSKLDFIKVMKEQFSVINSEPSFMKPVHYYIDEAHNYFNAREWQEIGRGLLYYISQHRHLHDNVFFLTQALALVEKQVKCVAQDYEVLRNLYKESIGMFKQKSAFRRRCYYSEPNGTAEHHEETFFKLDVEGIASCYQTCGAVGIGTGEAEQDKKPRKLPYWAIFAFGGVAFAAIMAVLSVAPGAVTQGMFSAMTPATNQAVGAATQRAPSLAGFSGGSSRQAAAVAPASGQVWLTGRYNIGGVWTVVLSDGRKFRTDRDLEQVQEISEDWVQIAGVKYYWKRNW